MMKKPLCADPVSLLSFPTLERVHAEQGAVRASRDYRWCIGPCAAQESVPFHQGHLHSKERTAIAVTGPLPTLPGPKAPHAETEALMSRLHQRQEEEIRKG